jgi:hypothetical protein
MNQIENSQRKEYRWPTNTWKIIQLPWL